MLPIFFNLRRVCYGQTTWSYLVVWAFGEAQRMMKAEIERRPRSTDKDIWCHQKNMGTGTNRKRENVLKRFVFGYYKFSIEVVAIQSSYENSTSFKKRQYMAPFFLPNSCYFDSSGGDCIFRTKLEQKQP